MQLSILFPERRWETCTEVQLAMAVGLPHVRSSAVWASVVGKTMCKQLKLITKISPLSTNIFKLFM
jgi:hypothetical protein